MKTEPLYIIEEISRATGIPKATLHGRRRRLGIPSSRDGYTLAEVKRMIKGPKRRRLPLEQNIKSLRAQLLNDGAL